LCDSENRSSGKGKLENRLSLSGTSSTLSTEAFERLREDILSGAIRPGAKLHIRDQCARLGIGLSPMREALNRLAAQGLATQSDQRGFTAAPLDLEDLADLTQARTALNTAALRDAIAHGDDSWEEGLLFAHHRLARLPRGGGATSAEWEARHSEFHTALLAGCRSGRLKLYCEQLFMMCDRYRRLSRAAAEKRDVAAEHATILNATLARSTDEAVAQLDSHVRRTDELVRLAVIGAKLGVDSSSGG
jgi:DNA-binding GntR family transcriptional regulator